MGWGVQGEGWGEGGGEGGGQVSGQGQGCDLKLGIFRGRHLGAGRRVRPPLLGQHELIARDVRLDLFRDGDRGEGQG